MTVRAYVFVKTTNPGPRAACRAIRKIPGVVRADALFGGPPIIVIVEGRNLAEMDTPIDAIVHLPMVTDTETHVVRDIEKEDTARIRTRR
jgi:DNA-binding Lrp family transcriptional regulator